MDLVGWNGDIPRAKLFATPLNDLFGDLAFKDSVSATYTPAGTVTSTASGTAVTLTAGTLPSCSYDPETETLTFNAGAFPTVDTVTDPTVTSTFAGTTETITSN